MGTGQREGWGWEEQPEGWLRLGGWRGSEEAAEKVYEAFGTQNTSSRLEQLRTALIWA